VKFAALMIHLSRQWPKPQGMVLTKRDLDFDTLGQVQSKHLESTAITAAEQSFPPVPPSRKAFEVMTEQGIYTASQDYYLVLTCCHEYVELAPFGPNCVGLLMCPQHRSIQEDKTMKRWKPKLSNTGVFELEAELTVLILEREGNEPRMLFVFFGQG